MHFLSTFDAHSMHFDGFVTVSGRFLAGFWPFSGHFFLVFFDSIMEKLENM
jgi:hypothetical protein